MKIKIPIFFNKHWEITTTQCIFEILLPNGKYIMYIWDNNHKLIEKNVWKI